MGRPFIEMQRVTKRFCSHPVLSDMTWTAFEGEVLGLVGPNGSGKTTSVRLLNGVLKADAGDILVGGLDPLAEGDKVRQMSGLLTESADFYRHMSALENLRFFSALYGIEDDRRAKDLLTMFGLESDQDRKVGTYSTGMRKRLGLAKALLHRPSLLFLDEPTNGLDPDGTRQVLDVIADLNHREGTTVLLCSHLLQQLETICDRYVFIDQGRVIETGTFDELEAKYYSDIKLVVETDLELSGDMYGDVPANLMDDGRLRFTLPGKDAVPEFLRRLVHDARVYDVQTVDRDLESLYFKIREVHVRV